MGSLLRSNVGLMGAPILAVFLVLAIWTAVTKAPWCDEGWFASPGWNLAFRGFMQQAYRDPRFHEGDFPIAESVAREVLSLPIFPEMQRSQIEIVCDAVRARKRRRGTRV